MYICIFLFVISMQARWKKFVRDLERIKKQSSVIHFSMLGMYERECRRLLLCMTAMVAHAVRRSSYLEEFYVLHLTKKQ